MDVVGMVRTSVFLKEGDENRSQAVTACPVFLFLLTAGMMERTKSHLPWEALGMVCMLLTFSHL